MEEFISKFGPITEYGLIMIGLVILTWIFCIAPHFLSHAGYKKSANTCAGIGAVLLIILMIQST